MGHIRATAAGQVHLERNHGRDQRGEKKKRSSGQDPGTTVPYSHLSTAQAHFLDIGGVAAVAS